MVKCTLRNVTILLAVDTLSLLVYFFSRPHSSHSLKLPFKVFVARQWLTKYQYYADAVSPPNCVITLF